VSKYTAGLLAKCIDVDSSLANFGDIAFVAFGETGRVTVSSLISLELMVACVGLIILFADTVGYVVLLSSFKVRNADNWSTCYRSLIDGPSQIAWKVLAGCILAPLQFLPMNLLGFTSFLGIFCNLVIIVVAIVVGLIKMHYH
jgi:solute carrier family 32 (vesicular inhibitory amino acid transporter)